MATLALAVGGTALVDWRAGTREARSEAAYPPTGRIIDVVGVPVHVHDAGGNGPDLVLIHGASGNTRDYTFQFADRLTDRYRVLVVDRPGLGWTGRADPAYRGIWNRASESPAEQARLLHAAVAEMGVEAPIVMGHSFGGAVALAWALERPGNIAGLVVLAGASNPWPGDLGALYHISASRIGGATLVPLAAAFATPAQTEAVVTRIFAPQAPPEGYAEGVAADLSLRRESQRANARQVTSLRPHIVEMSARYGTIDVPTEIVHGTADTIVPIAIHSEPLSRQIPGAVLTRLDGIGHMPHHVAPDAVIAAIDRAAARAQLR